MVCEGKGSLAVGLQKGVITSVELQQAANKQKELDLRMLKVAEMLSI